MSQDARIGIDIGGTFTDVALEWGSKQYSIKILTTHNSPEEGVLAGLREVAAASGISPSDVSLIIHGTTLATNALIERKGAKTALVTTEGFRDTLEIRSEDRYEQYDLNIDLPPPLVPRYLRLPVSERIDAHGQIRKPLDRASVEQTAHQLASEGVEAVAVGFLHSYLNPTHEQAAGKVLSDILPDVAITLSSDVAPEMREYDRFSTAAANAYVQPLMAGYLDRLHLKLKDAGFGCPLLLMLSGGGLTTVDTAKRFPVRLVESGPAGGAAFAADIARQNGLDNVLSFDMGGTTAKLCLIDDGKPQTSRGFEVARVWRFRKGSGLPLRIPVIEMVEIGAGGGSLAHVDALGRITIGPQSAGSEPGPACYGRGGSGATVTDADVVLGRIDADNFAGGRMQLDHQAARKAVASSVGQPLDLNVTHAALGVAEMVEETMASAARVHAVERGAEISNRTMIAFGGAAPIHAMRMAEKLSINRVLIPERAGVGSAIGFLRAAVSYEVVRTLRVTLDDLDPIALNELLATSEKEARDIVLAATADQQLTVERKGFMRYVGQGHEIEVALPGKRPVSSVGSCLRQAFEDAYRSFYGRLVPDGRIECLTWSVRVSAVNPAPTAAREKAPAVNSEASFAAEQSGVRAMVDPATGIMIEIPMFERSALVAGCSFSGPAVITEDETTIFVSAAFHARVGPDGMIDCNRKDLSE